MSVQVSCLRASCASCPPRFAASRWLVALAVPLCLLLASLAALAETWVDASGQYKVEAQFIALKGNDLYLKKQNGVTIKVPLDKLDAASQEQARRLAAAAAPAPAAAGTPEATVQAIKQGVEAGNLRVVWDAMPASYQKDVNDVVHAFAENMDTELWTKGTTILKKATQVLKTKKKFILAHPALDNPLVPKDQLEGNWDNLVGVLEAVLASELADLSKLKTIDLGAFLDGSGKKIVEKIMVLAKAAEASKLPVQDFPGLPVDAVAGLVDTKITACKVDGDKATLSTERDGKVEQHEAVRIEGKWLPKAMVDEWSTSITKAKEALTKEMKPALEKNKFAVLMPMGIIEGVLDQLLAADTQEKFNQVVEEVMKTFQAKPAPGKPVPPAPAPAP